MNHGITPSENGRVTIDLAGLTTMRVGGPAARLVTADSADAVLEAVCAADAAGEPLLVLSGGSNLVVADEGFPGTVVRIVSRGTAVESASACAGVSLRVAAGHPWDELVAQTLDQGWSGIEALSGIPGAAGATPVQNVGAYGQEVAQTIAQVRTWDRAQGQVRTFAAADCGFGYRSSRFKSEQLGPPGAVPGGPRYVVLEVVFQLESNASSQPIRYADLARQLGVATGERVPLAAAREAVLAQRRQRGMVLDDADPDTWGCGSFFTNPVLDEAGYAALAERAAARLSADQVPPRFPGGDGAVKTSAAWLIERAGFHRGFGMPGPAALSTKHTLAVTNRGSATAADVIALARTVRDGVAEAFGVTLVSEPVLVGCSLD